MSLMPGWSDEVHRMAWEDGAAGPSVGVRFTDYNKQRAFGLWQTSSVVAECEITRVVARAVGDSASPGGV
jgi:hypothetical protein